MTEGIPEGAPRGAVDSSSRDMDIPAHRRAPLPQLLSPPIYTHLHFFDGDPQAKILHQKSE